MTDMNDIDIEELGARLNEVVSALHDERWYTSGAARIEALIFLRKYGAAMFDAIETGRQWETIARQTDPYTRHKDGCKRTSLDVISTECTCGLDAMHAAFGVLADRTPTPTDGE